MDIINTIAPISIEELKKYFVNKDTKYIIDYKNSKLKGLKLLTYLSNLDVPCDIQLDILDPEFIDLLRDYLTCPFIVNIELLELATIHLLFHAKDMIEEVPPNALNVSSMMSKFVVDNPDIINKWVNILDSLTLYNMYIVEEPTFVEFVKSHPLSEESSPNGINFVSLLKHEVFYSFYERIDRASMKYYQVYFDEYIFKGKNLYSYWANENNPLFLLTASIANGTAMTHLAELQSKE